LIVGWTTLIRSNEGVFYVLLSVDTWTAAGVPSLSVWLDRNIASEGAMAIGLRELKLAI
jgi:hypothetical protein